MSCAGRIYLAPESSKVKQFWLNIGCDIYDDFAVPPWISDLEACITRDQYESLMHDMKGLFSSRSRGCCRCNIFVTRRKRFDDAFDAIMRRHQRASVSPINAGSGLTPLNPHTFKWAYGQPMVISPHKAFDHLGVMLTYEVPVNGVLEERAAWPPPFYNIVLVIPDDKYKAIRKGWPGSRERSTKSVTRNPMWEVIAAGHQEKV